MLKKKYKDGDLVYSRRGVEIEAGRRKGTWGIRRGVEIESDGRGTLDIRNRGRHKGNMGH